MRPASRPQRDLAGRVTLELLAPDPEAAPPVPAGRGRRATRLRAAFVNNMPDAAFAVTERQFLGLLEAGSGDDVTVEVRRYGFAALPRGDLVDAYRQRAYFPLDELWDTAPDLVVVSGCEPRAAEIEDEPYWPEGRRLAEWGLQSAGALVMSCLAAHFVLHAVDGLPRRSLAEKCSGVFAHDPDPDSVLAAGLVPGQPVPHSRRNDMAVTELVAAGYRIDLSATEVGWTAATAQRGDCWLLAFQGHPEYEPTSLLREYKRDAARFALGERPDGPVLPVGCTAPEDAAAIAAFHRDLCRGAVGIEGFDFDAAARRAPWPWRSGAEILYRNGITHIVARRSALGR